MKFNIAYPTTGCQKKLEIVDDQKLERCNPGGEIANYEGRASSRSLYVNNCKTNGLRTDFLETNGKIHEVDILGCKEGVSSIPVKTEGPDADSTEQSSSFGDTFSGSDEGLKINSNDMEVESPLIIQGDQKHSFGGPIRLFKKKKVTTDWRKFVSPLMWRCQWLEIRMKELQSQAVRYDKELEVYTHEKKLLLKMIDLNDSVSRSVPLTSKSYKKPAMKRRKRKRNEDSINMLSYMSNHNIFSYYENKKCETDGHSVDDDFPEQGDDIMQGSNDHLWALGFRDGDRALEQILLNIEALQSRVLKVKAHLGQIISINVKDVPLGCSFMGHQPVSSAQSPSCSHDNEGHQLPVGVPNSLNHHGSDYEMDDMVLPSSAVSSFGDAPDIDIIESTVDLLSGANGSLDPKQLQDFCKANSDDVLISNHAADEELHNFEVSHLRGKPRGLATIQHPHSDDGSTTPASAGLDPAAEGPEDERVSAPPQACHTAKRRGRKPKRRRRGSSVIALKNERHQVSS